MNSYEVIYTIKTSKQSLNIISALNKFILTKLIPQCY